MLCCGLNISRWMRWQQVTVIMTTGAALSFPLACRADTSHPGEEHYRRVCADCHKKGRDKNKLSKGAPRTGDRTAWESRVKKGVDSLCKTIVSAPHHGKLDDPAWEKANQFIWRDDLSEEQIRAALEYMFSRVSHVRPKSE